MPRLKDRRRRKRIDVALPIKIDYNKGKVSTKTKNISILGTYVEIDKEIPVGTDLDIQIKISKAASKKKGKIRMINCRGDVFRCHPVIAEEKKQYGIGVFFRSFYKDGEKELSEYIDYILKQEKKLGKIYMRKKKQKKLKRKGGKR